jgi:hypothetical protein
VNWSFWAKISDGEVVDKMFAGDLPKDFTITVNGHDSDSSAAITFAVSVLKPEEADE